MDMLFDFETYQIPIILLYKGLHYLDHAKVTGNRCIMEVADQFLSNNTIRDIDLPPISQKAIPAELPIHNSAMAWTLLIPLLKYKRIL